MGVSLEQAQVLMRKLETELDKRCKDIKVWDDYYAGRHNLGFASDRFKEAFGGLFSDFADNWCEPVVDAPVERLEILGFRFGEGDTATPPEQDDKDARDMFQRNNLDAWSKVAFLETHVKARSFMLVWVEDPDAEEPQPEITVEDPTQMIVAYRPGSRRERVAALKRWEGEDGFSYATLYLPDELWKFRRASTSTSGLVLPPGLRIGQWETRGDENEFQIPNPIGKVPVVEFANKQRLIADPVPEHKSVIPLQDAVNKLVADMMVAAEAGAFPARWGTGVDVPIDPATGQEILDKDLWKASVSKLLRASDPNARFGNFEAADLRNFVSGIDMLVQHVAAITRTPPHYLLAQLVNVSGDALDSAEAGLGSKCHDKTVFLGEPAEETMRLGFAVKEDPRKDAHNAETIWRDVQHRSESQLVDASVKKKDAGVPWRQRMEDLGYSQTTIDRMEAQREADARIAAAASAQPDPGADPAAA